MNNTDKVLSGIADDAVLSWLREGIHPGGFMNGLYCAWCGHVVGSDESGCVHCREDSELETLRKEYNAAVANGLMLKARRIDRRMSSISRSAS